MDAEITPNSAPATASVPVEASTQTLDRLDAAIAAVTENLTGALRVVEGLQAAVRARAADITRREATLATQTAAGRKLEADLTQRRRKLDEAEAALKAREVDLADREQKLATERNALTREQRSLTIAREEAEQARAELARTQEALEELEQELSARERKLVSREGAVESIQAALAGVADALAQPLPGFASLQPSPVTPTHAGKPASVAPKAAHAMNMPDEPPTDADEPGARVCDPRTSSSRCDGAPLAAIAPVAPAGKQKPRDARAVAATLSMAAQGDSGTAHETRDGASTSDANDTTVDEAALTPDELERLCVLRRLAGGRHSDAELLARVRRERSTAATKVPQAGKSKRRWWRTRAPD